MTPQELLRLMGERQAPPPSAPTPEDITRFLALSAGLAAPAPNVHAQPQYAPPGTTLAAGNPAQQFPLGTTGYGYRQGPAAFHYDVQESGIEAPHPLLDPVDLAAGALTPAGLRAFRALGQKLDDPLPMAALRSGRQGVLRSQKGNLGPPPVDAQGRPLPESVIREIDHRRMALERGIARAEHDIAAHTGLAQTPEGAQKLMTKIAQAREQLSAPHAGNLKRLYHGTGRTFDDFSLTQTGSGAGGDLYGPGIYLTESPEVAGGTGKPPDLGYAGVEGIGADAAPQVRPVYANLKKVFDIDAPIDLPTARLLLRDADVPLGKANLALERMGRRNPRGLTGDDIYAYLEDILKDKTEVNRVLREAGYDGIAHTGGGIMGTSSHQVYIAFSPDDVYPAPNVESLLQLLRTKEP